MTTATLPAMPFAELMEERARDAAPAWLTAFRRSGAERFAAVGLPSSKDEDWRFTPMQGLARPVFGAVSQPGIVTAEALCPFLLGTDRSPLLVLVDGRFEPSL